MTETPAPSPSNPADTAVVAAPPLAPGAAPLCYVVDEEASIRHFLSLVLHGSGVDTMEFFRWRGAAAGAGKPSA